MLFEGFVTSRDDRILPKVCPRQKLRLSRPQQVDLGMLYRTEPFRLSQASARLGFFNPFSFSTSFIASAFDSASTYPNFHGPFPRVYLFCDGFGDLAEGMNPFNVAINNNL